MKSEILGAKEIKDGISFNVALATEFGYIYLIGLRVWKGLLMPPATRSGSKYYPVNYMGKDLAEWIYQQLIDQGWVEQFKLALKRKELCIDPLIMDIQTYASHFE